MAKQSRNKKVAFKVTSSLLHLILNVAFYVAVIIILVKACTFTYQFSYQIFGSVRVDEAPGVERVVEIKPKEKTMDLATALEMKKLVANKYSFYLRTKLTGQNIIPGTYTLNSSMDYSEILDTITKYDSENEKASQ